MTDSDKLTNEPRGLTDLEVDQLWSDTLGLVTAVFAQINWLEEEITKAQGRHPDQADRLHHTFELLQPPPGMPDTEWLVRAHAAELLERVAAGVDTRPATNAEICTVASHNSLEAPLVPAAEGLYMRAMARILPAEIEHPAADDLEHLEQLYGSEIDAMERRLRHDIARKRAERVVDPNPVCDGFHNGNQVICSYQPDPTLL